MPDIEVFPNGDWGMKIDDADGMTVEEVRAFMSGVADLRKGIVRSPEEIKQALKESN